MVCLPLVALVESQQYIKPRKHPQMGTSVHCSSMGTNCVWVVFQGRKKIDPTQARPGSRAL